jgi:hypothetical protein
MVVLFPMRILFPTLFCLLLGATDATAQSPITTASGEAPVGVASGEAPATDASGKTPAAAKTPVPAIIRSKAPAPAARGKTFELGLGYSYVSHAENQSKRVGLQGADASFTIGFSRMDIQADVGYARASNVLGTGRHSDVLTYLAGPVFHPTTRRNFDTYVHVW